MAVAVAVADTATVTDIAAKAANPVRLSFETGALSFSAVQLLAMQKTIRTLSELEEEAVRFVGALALGAHATLITLSGELGAGKTAFIKTVAWALGVEEIVTSPTFVLEKIYVLPERKAFRRLVHIDAYRLLKGSDLAPLGFDELMQDAHNLVMLEWPERVKDALPEPTAKISITVHTDDSRTISYG